MKEQLALLTLIIILAISTSWRSADNSYMANEICQKTFAKTKTIKTLRYEMRKEERIGEDMQVQVSFIKLNRVPYQVYMKQISPQKGLEVLYKEQENDGKALVSPNGFPWITLKMDPEGSTMRKNQHHTTKDAGFDLVISILEHLFEKYDEDLDQMLTMSGEVTYDDQKCHQIVFSNDQYKYIKYKVRSQENVLQIARKYKLCSYLIMEKNQDLSSYDDIKEGDEILIPNDYSPKMELLIDKVRFIPLSIKVYDDLGVFEHYQYSAVEIDPVFTEHDFSGDNREYGF